MPNYLIITLHDPYGTDIEKQIKTKLEADEQITLLNAHTNKQKLTMPFLQQFSVVLVDTLYNSFDTPTTVGNLFYNYCMEGHGSVVIMCYANSRNGKQHLEGQFEDVFPLTYNNSYTSGQCALNMDSIADKNHELVRKVHKFDGGSYSGRVPCELRTDNTAKYGATNHLLATWNDGTPLIAYRLAPNHVIVALNFVAASSDSLSQLWLSDTDGAQLMYNALQFCYKRGKKYRPWNIKLLSMANQQVYTNVKLEFK